MSLKDRAAQKISHTIDEVFLEADTRAKTMISAAYIRTAAVSAILALVTSTNLIAQRYTFRQYGSQEGLTNLSVNCLFQDRTGYLWVGTDNGLFRYDGSSFRSFSHAEGLPNSEIRGLAESPDGALWVATQGGVARSIGNQFKAVDLGEQGRVQKIAFDRLGRVYVEHISGVIRGVPDGAGSYRFSTVVRGMVRGLFVNGEDVWFSREGDLWFLKGEESKRIGSPAGLPVDQWDTVTQDSLGNLWTRSPTQLYELPHGQTRFLNRSEGVPHTTDSRLFADPFGRLYVSSNAGVVILYGANRTYFDPQHGLPSDNVGPILLDRQESLWLGMLGGGLVRRLGHGEWTSWKKEDGLLNNSVWAVLHDGAGRLWVGTSGGLNIFGPDGALAQSWSTRNGLAGDRVRSITEGPAGDFFVGTLPGGISRFSKNGILLQSYGLAAGLTKDEIVATALDRQNRLWAVGNGGCFRSLAPLSTSASLKFERIEIPGIAARTFFRDVLVGQDGVVWVSTSNGLVRFDEGNWKVFTERNGLKSSDLSAIIQGQGSIWVAYRDALGIGRLQFHGDQVEATRITTEDGLSSDLIYALTFDTSGRLWATTDNGVNVLEQGRWRHYGMEDGLIWDDGDDLALSADLEGNVWVGTSGGLSRFAPLHYTIPDSPPPIVLTSIQGGAQAFQPEDKPVLSHAQNSLLIQYSGLNYSSETRTRFRYRLTGYEKNWNETLERNVHFAGLPAGKYVFEVVAAGPNGLWSPVPARFAFSVKPPWWLSWWFIAACVLAALLLGRALWRYRVRVLVAQKELLEQQVIDRTAELRESHRQLEEIAYYDALTSLPNRRMFTEQFRSRLALARRHDGLFTLLLIDLDAFKQTNDSFGHDAGDAVLMGSANLLRAAVRESDCVARLGGDEFAILLISPTDPAGIEMVCKRIVGSFDGGISFNGTTLKATCSVGVAVFPADGDAQESLYKSADMALYEAKRRGGNTSCRFRPEMQHLPSRS
jgi:diguanylate cyclase (GGDEF)-like protein